MLSKWHNSCGLRLKIAEKNAISKCLFVSSILVDGQLNFLKAYFQTFCAPLDKGGRGSGPNSTLHTINRREKPI